MGTEEVPMAYPLGAVERAMKVQEVVLRTLDGKLSWLQAADIPGRSPRSIRFERGGADAERIVAGEWWRTVTALTLHADAPHVIGNAGASAVLVGAVGHQLGPGVGLCVLLLAGAGGNALTAAAHGTHHDSVGASTAMFGAIGILGATRVVSRGRRRAARTSWMVVAA